MKKTSKELFFAISITVISLLLLITSFTYPLKSSQFPRFLCGIMLLLSILILLRALRSRAGVQKSTNTEENSGSSIGKLKVPAIIFSLTIAYVAGIMYIGYFVSSVIFLIGTMTIFGKQRFLTKTIATAGFLIVVYALFVSFLGLRLPQGLLF
ncbi:MAG: tripartite tricarboxylate transporter TctB family protein [Synergistaceae bacterium]|nr:tripartite tricarboxylate transporter TctB family protein [Synergistaceae bacterium]